MDDKQAMHAMSIDDAYHVGRTLARGPSGVTELVTLTATARSYARRFPLP